MTVVVIINSGAEQVLSFWEFLLTITDPKTLNDVFLLIVGAAVSMLFQQVSRVWNLRGKLKVYYANYYDRVFGTNACFMQTRDKNGKDYACCVLPIQLDFVNTSGRKQVFRAVSAVAYRNGKQVAVFNPINRGRCQQAEDAEFKHYGTICSSYSFTVSENECVHTDLLFVHEVDGEQISERVFDEVRIQWYDRKDKVHIKSILRIQKCWEPGKLDIPVDWQRLH